MYNVGSMHQNEPPSGEPSKERPRILASGRGMKKASRVWLGDFAIVQGGLLVKKTGAHVPINRTIVTAVLNWFAFYFAVEGKRIKRAVLRKSRADLHDAAHPSDSSQQGSSRSGSSRPGSSRSGSSRSGSSRNGPRIAFYPERPRPWYLVWAVTHVTGAQIVHDPAEADILFQFDDTTEAVHLPPKNARSDARYINAQCHDVSKSRVSEAWEAASGDALRVDPRSYHGPAVEKSELNGAHDGRIVQCPTEPLPDRVYQRLINNEVADGLVEDLRTPTIGGKPICVFKKRRPLTSRFDNDNLHVELAWPEACYSATELAQISHFCASLGLDWGGVDVLRDKETGKIFIVDANKTDMGPPTALPLKDKLTATQALADALRDHFISGSNTPPKAREGF